MSFKMEVKLNNIDTTERRVRDAVDDGLFAVSQAILQESQNEYVPVISGWLRSSGYVKRTGDMEYEVGYSADYALWVHEAPPDWGQGKNKFLEKPMLKAGPKIEATVARYVRSAIG